MTLESQIQQFIDHSKPGDAILLSKDGDLELGTGLILKSIGAGFALIHDGRQLGTWNRGIFAVNKEFLLWDHTVDSVLKEALLWSYRTGRELATPDPEPTIGHQLMQRCYRRGLSEHEARSLIRDLLGDVAAWLDQRHSGSSQTADLLRAIFP